MPRNEGSGRRRQRMAKLTVLIVDDDRSFTADLERDLRANGHDVATASTKADAQEAARSNRPHMVILGAIAPRGDAFHVHQWLRRSSQFQDTPIIVVDAPPEKHLLKGWRKDEGMQLDCEDYLERPVATMSILARIEKAMDRATGKIKVLVADDHAVVRDGICAVLSLQKDIQVIGEAVDGKDAIEKAQELLPDVVLMDIAMPIMNGLEATQALCSRDVSTKVLILSQYDDQDNVKAGKQAGALGFIPKKSASSELVAGIRSVYAGRELVHPIAS
jgi:DNA-binding NarL/FixJ family response regulator